LKLVLPLFLIVTHHTTLGRLPSAARQRYTAIQEDEAVVRQDDQTRPKLPSASVMVTPATPLFPLPSKLTAVLVSHSRPRSTSSSRVLLPLMRAALRRPSSLRAAGLLRELSVCLCSYNYLLDCTIAGFFTRAAGTRLMRGLHHPAVEVGDKAE
jgi:hypothetical protein